MEGTVASEKKLVGTLSSGSTMTGGMGTVFARDGKDGFSPNIYVGENDDGYHIEIETANQGFQVLDIEHGTSPTVHISELDGGHEVSITDVEDVKSFFVKDGIDGKDGVDGKDGADGKDGVDGTVAFEELTEAQRESLRGEPGESYVLTDADKREIANMIEGSEATVPQTDQIPASEYIVDQIIPHAEEEVKLDDVLMEIFAGSNTAGAILVEHTDNLDNPHQVTCEQIGAVKEEELEERLGGYVDWDGLHTELDGALECYPNNDVLSENYYTKEEVDEAVAAGKAILVTVSGSTPSHTNEQIFNTVLNGGAVYLKMWSGTYIRLSWCTSTEANFEASLVNSIKAADGKSYPAQNFRLYSVYNDKYSGQSATVPSQAYVDAQIDAKLAQASIAYVGSVAPTNDMGKDGDIYIVSG